MARDLPRPRAGLARQLPESDTLEEWRRRPAIQQMLMRGVIVEVGQMPLVETEMGGWLRARHGDVVGDNGATPRTSLGEGVFTSTDYPGHLAIDIHAEAAYANVFPRYIAFGCVRAAASGGATPVADARDVLRSLDASLKDELEAKGVMYVRNFHRGLGRSWQDVFQTTSPSEVEHVCALAGAEATWTSYGLRVTQLRAPVITHPATGERCWFNQVVAHHVLAAPDPEMLRSQFDPMELPKTTFLGDGRPIADDAVLAIRRVQDRLAMPIEWQPGIAVIIDNLLAGHGRQPFKGERRVVVSMAGPAGWS